MKRKEPPEEGPKMSPLCRTVPKDGSELEIHIYEDGEGGWLLEVVNEENTSTAWREPFETEQAALDEALKTIRENGLEYFRESEPWRQH
jgi:hypothetical protein